MGIIIFFIVYITVLLIAWCLIVGGGIKNEN